MTHPELAKQAVGWDPSQVTAGSEKKVAWMCERGHIWEAWISNRTKRKDGCSICSGHQVQSGINDLRTEFPKIAEQAHGWDPGLIRSRSGKRLTWRCEFNHEWITSPDNRVRGRGCPLCSGNTVVPGVNDFATTHPELALEAHLWDPTTVYSGSAAVKDWICPRGHVWRTEIRRRCDGVTCLYCSNQKVMAGFNDLATTNPALANEAYGWDPTTLIAKSGKSRKWICSNGHVWSAKLSNRSNGTGCPTCSPTNYDPNSRGWLYLLRHDSWKMLQIGITNFPEDRLQSHRRLGWEVIELRGPTDGLIAREWESSILKMLKRRGARLAPVDVAGKFDGYTESWLLESHVANSLRDLMDAVQADED